ncbi:ornithine--oxo-acid transaminase [Aquicella lusitana]|uniref:ornithine aminotransferase n=1 Tax=Aquicella lusitana TaxID=254246 RepID=A0A370GB24_9COXI|nr:ornithine--oxo-acid transaminase [Aquicella lusitana]RDI40995.1 ornithine--oxo-acid transaminase [Aquicella lusitana]VVC73600.1 Ornithine aminotransferase [Aquicella lusitana]
MANPVIERERLYGAHNYEPLPVVLTRGEGVYVWDDAGKRYIDMMSAYSAVSHGHCHPRLVKVLKEQAEQLNIVSRAFYTDKLGPFLERVCELTGFEKALPMNTGAEAVETALKAARKWAYSVKGVEADQAEVIACAGNFHGRTITVVSMSTEPQYRAGFGPFTPGFKIIPYGDVSALENAITPRTAAFLVEPIKGEGGIVVPPEGYLKACEAICRQHNVLMICDEIQTGLGRTGKLLAYQHEAIQPDGVVLGKALGGGILPVSLFLTRREVMDVFTPGDHGSTFGGNPLAAAVGKAALDLLMEDQLIERAARMGDYFQAQLKRLVSPLIKDVRGKGLLIGLEIDEKYPARILCLKLLQHGVLTRDTHGTVIRFAPPLIITEEQIDTAVSALQKVLAEADAEVKEKQ